MGIEIWKPIIGLEGHYEISSFGRVRSLNRFDNRGHKVRENFTKLQSDKDGYNYVGFTKNGIKMAGRVHRLVAIAFMPNPENKPHVNHIDGNKTNNKIENLEWCTAKENIAHSWELGLSYRHTSGKGEKSHKAKLKDRQVIEIFHAKGTHRQIAKQYGVDPTQITRIKQEKTWSHVVKYI